MTRGSSQVSSISEPTRNSSATPIRRSTADGSGKPPDISAWTTPETTARKANPKDLHILGSAAENVVRHANCPVLVARPSPQGKVLAATDFSDHALVAVEAGVAEARRRKTDLAIIHAIDLLPVLSPFYEEFYGLASRDLRDQMRKLWQQRLEEGVHRYKAKGGGLLRDGLAAPAILSAASELPAQLLVLGTQGRTGLSRMALGSVAETVVRAAPCSVLIVRSV